LLILLIYSLGSTRLYFEAFCDWFLWRVHAIGGRRPEKQRLEGSRGIIRMNVVYLLIILFFFSNSF
jgi:hypothetical protein